MTRLVLACRVLARKADTAIKSVSFFSFKLRRCDMAKAKDAVTVSVEAVRLQSVKMRLIGTTPLFQNRMSEKAKQVLLVGGRRKGNIEKLAAKHSPLDEFRGSAEVMPDGPTALGLQIKAVKSAMCDAAIETAGMTKTGAQRLLFMPGDLAPLYGVPQLRMDVTRCADQNRTPDVRTRAYLPRWACEVTISYVVPQLTAQAAITLLCNAGILIGVGDYRQQKGKGAYGAFRVVAANERDPEWEELVKTGGRKQQLAALAAPEPADDNTRELMEFWRADAKRRESTDSVGAVRVGTNGAAKRRKEVAVAG